MEVGEDAGLFVLKSSLDIKYVGADIDIGGIRLPRMLFYPIEKDDPKLRLRRPWRRESWMVVPRGYTTLHYCITSEHSTDLRRFYIPPEILHSPARS